MRSRGVRLRVARALRRTRRPVLVEWGAFPDNPWQQVVADGARAARIEVVTTDHAVSLAPWAVRARRERVVVHCNWTAPISQRASTPTAALAAVAAALRDIDVLRSSGGRLLWTLHNERAHELVHPEAEAALLEGLAARADVIHLMHEVGRGLLPQAARDRAVVVPHPSYDGVYRVDGTRQQARDALGVPDGAVAVLAFGLLRPYKDVQATVRGFLAARAGGLPVHLLVAGQPGQGYDPAWLEPLAGRDDVTLHVERVADDDVDRWHRAADVVAMPQRTGLNSGVLLLAATFGLPVVAGPSKAARSRDGEGWVVVEDPTSDDWLRRGIERMPADAGARARRAATAVAPDVVGASFAGVVRGLAARR